jgi:hypothetical protein
MKKKGQYIDHGHYIVYNNLKSKNSRRVLLLEIKSIQGLSIEIWDIDFDHALEGHPEVTLDRIIDTLKDPMLVIKSKKSNLSCLFYKLEMSDHPVFGKIYFCVVVMALGKGRGKMETAYETTFIKTGEVIFSRNNDKKR